MTTAAKPVKPLADHGTTARAKGRPASGIPGCPCPLCRAAENRYDKRRRFLNATGRTANVPAQPVANHLEALFAAGAGWTQLSAASDVSCSVISRIRRGLQPTVRRAVAARLLAIQPGDAIPPGRPIPTTGTVRRIRALMALGHGLLEVGAAANIEHSMMTGLLNERQNTVARHVAERLAAAYRKLATTTGTSTRSRNRAAREGWAPPAAWDDIDNPDAHPDWTGHCGTDQGWHVHQLQKLPMCGRCEDAHTQWLADRAHLGGRERGQALFTARREATDRGPGLAEDIHELLGRHYDTAEIAARLGITRDVLQKTLKRHPATAA